jgi:hypothetical protein
MSRESSRALLSLPAAWMYGVLLLLLLMLMGFLYPGAL